MKWYHYLFTAVCLICLIAILTSCKPPAQSKMRGGFVGEMKEMAQMCVGPVETTMTMKVGGNTVTIKCDDARYWVLSE